MPWKKRESVFRQCEALVYDEDTRRYNQCPYGFYCLRRGRKQMRRFCDRHYRGSGQPMFPGGRTRELAYRWSKRGAAVFARRQRRRHKKYARKSSKNFYAKRRAEGRCVWHTCIEKSAGIYCQMHSEWVNEQRRERRRRRGTLQKRERYLDAIEEVKARMRGE